MDKAITCGNCKKATFYYQRFDNQYVCKKNADKDGRISEQDLKGHRANYFCADAVRR